MQRAATLGDSLPEIGNRLHADIVVNGTMRRLKDKLSVSVTLTDVESGHQLWSAVFDRDAEDVLAIQREVANAVAGALRQKAEGGASTQQPREVLVYDNYLLGRFYRTRRTEKDLTRALGYFDKALQLDPLFVPANRGMAAAYLLLSFYGDEPLFEALENAQPFLERALELDPDDEEVQALIGLSHYLKGSPGLAEEYLMRTVATHPNLVEAWMWLGLARQQQGRLLDALMPLKRAFELEPLMVTSAVNYANALSWLGRDEEAIALLNNLATTVDETSENQAQLYRVLSNLQISQGNLADAYESASHALAVAPQSALSKANMAMISEFLGYSEQASKLSQAAFAQSVPGRGTMEYLARGTIMFPGMLPKDLLEARLAHLQRLPNVPEIEWRIANLDVGMSAYFAGELDKATTTLRKALDGRDYPLTRADDDIFVCLSLVDALRRSDRIEEAEDRLARCEEELQNAGRQGWDSQALAISRVRLAVLRGDQQGANQQLEALFDRGFRSKPLLLLDPILQTLQQSSTYQHVLKEIVSAVDTARKEISKAENP